MRMVHGVEDTSGMTAEQKFDRSVLMFQIKKTRRLGVSFLFGNR